MSLFLALLATAAQAHVTGGWVAIPHAAKDAEVQGAAKYAMAHFPRPARLARIVSARRQVVAGTNYRIRLKTGDGRTCDVQVWHKLDHGRELTQVTCWR